jgi:hypothetical protein
MAAQCSRHKNPLTTTDTLTSIALIHYDGDYAVDGCGYSVQIDDVFYKPINEDVLAKWFETHDNKRVKVEYRTLNEKVSFFCGMMPTELKGIEIISLAAL